jgi:hypothetical protein
MAFNFFTLQPKTVDILGVSFTYKEAKPTTPVVDVYSKFDWKNPGKVDEVPGLVLIEKQLNYGIWTSNLMRLLANAGSVISQTGDPYGVLYTATPTGFVYALPYLVQPGTSIRGEINNTWSDISQEQGFSGMLGAVPVVGGLMQAGYNRAAQIAEGVGRIVSPGVGYEPIKVFSGTQPRTIMVTFPLYNTISIESANNNYSFITLLGLQNLKTRTSFATYLPPKIYEVNTNDEGGVYMPFAYISRLDIQSIGTTRAIYDHGASIAGGGGRRIIPEAYKVNITLTELLPDSANIYAAGLEGKPVTVTLDASAPGGSGTGTTVLPNFGGTFPNRPPVIINPGGPGD